VLQLDFVLTKIYPRRQIKHDKKSFYAYVRSKTKFKATVGPLSNSSGQLYTQNVDMAEEFNKYFASVYTKEDTTNIPEASGVYQGTVNDSLQDVLVDRYFIQKRLQKLRTDKAPGADSLSPWYLSMIEDVTDSATDIHSDAEVTR